MVWACGDLDPPPIVSLDQGLAQDQTSKVSQPKLTTRERRDQQSIAVGLEPAERRLFTLGLGHQTETEIQKAFAMHKATPFRLRRFVPSPDWRRYSIDPGPVPAGIHDRGHNFELYEPGNHRAAGILCLFP